MTEIFKIKLTDIDKKGFLLLKSHKSKARQLETLLHNFEYVADKVKLQINSKGELIISSTSNTVLREESEESIASLELSQKQREYYLDPAKQLSKRNLNA